METTVAISGMTCGHCVASVMEELSALDGVVTVEVELNTDGLSRAVITSIEQIDPRQVGEAVAEAGYLVVPDNA